MADGKGELIFHLVLVITAWLTWMLEGGLDDYEMQ
jgi:hypothetical protein